MEIQQVDIKIEDFMLRLKGYFIRLDTGAGLMQEADDYHLDISSADEIKAIGLLKETYNEEYETLLKLFRKGEHLEAYSYIDKLKKRNNKDEN